MVVEKEAAAAAGVGAVGNSSLLEEAPSQLSHKLIQLFEHLSVIFSGKKCPREWKCRALVFQTYIDAYLTAVVAQCIKQNRADPKKHALNSFL